MALIFAQGAMLWQWGLQVLQAIATFEVGAAVLASPDTSTTTHTVDAETAERLALRNRSTFGAFLLAALQGRMPHGECAEGRTAALGQWTAALAALDELQIEVDQLRELSAAKPHTETVQ